TQRRVPRHRRRPGLRTGRRPGRGDHHSRGRASAESGAAGVRRIVDFAISHARLTLAVLAFLVIAGLSSYFTIPKEASPDVQIPIIYIQLSERGISPEDAERLLVRPVETQVKGVANLKERRSAAFEGGGYVLLEFEAGFNSDVALQHVRAKVDDAKRDLPSDAAEPGVH